ncbi:unnamed protein product [marine sediment metagenome]|uniref:PAS domain-containing protein n=1 Tax=marine sediment metagenome TaxID=412755 RepID=X1CPA6_9ZZZZ
MAIMRRWESQDPAPVEPEPESGTEPDRLAELEETARRYRELKRAIGDMMFVVDSAGRFLDVNERFAARLGYAASELFEMKLYEVVKDDAEDPRQRMMPFFARSAGQQTLRARSGEEVHVAVSSVGRYDQAGQFAGALVVCRDVPKEEEHAEAIADAAQEMNQPLSGIYGYSELLKGSVGPRDPAYRYARKIYEQSERLASLVKRIKAEQGAPPSGLTLGEQPSTREE